MPRSQLLSGMMRGALAGLAGTAAMDLFWYVRGSAVRARAREAGAAHPPASRAQPSRDRAPGDPSAPAEEVRWSSAPAPARVGRQLYEGVTQRTLEARFARVTGEVVHWGYGMWWGGLFGLAAARVAPPRGLWGPLFGTAVWGTSYLLLPVTGLYRPLWKCSLDEVVPDLVAHVVFGTGTAAAYALMNREVAELSQICPGLSPTR